MKLGRLVALLLVAACGGATVPPARTPVANTAAATAAPTIAGEYREPIEFQMLCEDGEGWCPEKGEDSLTITDAGPDAIDIAIELVRTNAHTCSFEGRLTRAPGAPEGTRRWVHEGAATSDDEAEPCTLVLEQTTGRITTTADGCRQWCGARATLDATFTHPPKQ